MRELKYLDHNNLKIKSQLEDLDIEVAYDKLMSDNRVFKLVDSTMSIEDIMDKISAGELLQ